MKYNITPLAKPRMTHRDRWAKRPCVTKYWAFKDECKAAGVTVMSGDIVTFYIPIPKSRKKKIQPLTPHTQRPDIDNLLKALFDAVLPEDSHIHTITAIKVWDDTGAIEITREI